MLNEFDSDETAAARIREIGEIFRSQLCSLMAGASAPTAGAPRSGLRPMLDAGGRGR